MKKTIYHGSDHVIEEPKFGFGKPYNDYGIGFITAIPDEEMKPNDPRLR